MSSINNMIAGLELAQLGWVVPDIHAAVKFLSNALGIPGFPQPEHIRARDLGMTYYGKAVAGEWLTTQTYNGRTFIELIQPVSGKSMFHDYLAQYPAGGTQHIAFRLPVSDFNRITSDLREQGYVVISEVNHPIARMAFFDTYRTVGLPPRLWASRLKDGSPSNKCRGPGENLFVHSLGRVQLLNRAQPRSGWAGQSGRDA